MKCWICKKDFENCCEFVLDVCQPCEKQGEELMKNPEFKGMVDKSAKDMSKKMDEQFN